MNPLSMIGAGTQLIGTIAGLWGSARANKKYDKELDGMIGKRERDLATTFNNDYSRDFFDTDVAKSSLRTMTDNYNKQLKTTESQMAGAGATEEAKIAGRTSANETYNQGLNKLTGYGTQYRDNLKRDYETQLRDLFGTKVNALTDQNNRKQASFSALMGNSSDLSNTVSTMFDDK